jgi:hypothetical protein
MVVRDGYSVRRPLLVIDRDGDGSRPDADTDAGTDDDRARSEHGTSGGDSLRRERDARRARDAIRRAKGGGGVDASGIVRDGSVGVVSGVAGGSASGSGSAADFGAALVPYVLADYQERVTQWRAERASERWATVLLTPVLAGIGFDLARAAELYYRQGFVPLVLAGYVEWYFFWPFLHLWAGGFAVLLLGWLAHRWYCEIE